MSRSKDISRNEITELVQVTLKGLIFVQEFLSNSFQVNRWNPVSVTGDPTSMGVKIGKGKF